MHRNANAGSGSKKGLSSPVPSMAAAAAQAATRAKYNHNQQPPPPAQHPPPNTHTNTSHATHGLSIRQSTDTLGSQKSARSLKTQKSRDSKSSQEREPGFFRRLFSGSPKMSFRRVSMRHSSGSRASYQCPQLSTDFTSPSLTPPAYVPDLVGSDICDSAVTPVAPFRHASKQPMVYTFLIRVTRICWIGVL